MCWDNWIEAIRRRKEGNSEIRREVDDGKTDAGRGGVAKREDADRISRSIGGDGKLLSQRIYGCSCCHGNHRCGRPSRLIELRVQASDPV